MRRKLLFLMGFVAVAAAMFVSFRNQFDSELFFSSFSHVGLSWICGSIAVTFVCYLVRSFRWRTLLLSLKQIPLGPLMSTTVLGFSAIFALGRAGELVRPVWIARRESIPVVASLAAIAVERVFDTLMTLLLFAASLALVEAPEGAGDILAGLSRAVLTVLAIATGTLGAFIIFHKHIDPIVAWLPFRRLKDLAWTFARGLAAISEVRRFVSVTFSSLILWLGIALQFWLMLTGLNLDLAFTATTLTLAMAALGSIVQIPAIGGGFQAAFVFCVTTFFGLPIETAVAASLLAWAITVGPTLLISAIYMMIKGISTKELVLERAESATP